MAFPQLYLGAARIYEVTPPAARLIGKSANYVDAYMDTYTKKVKRKRLVYVVTGCGLSSIVGCLIAAVGTRDAINSIESSPPLGSSLW